MCSSLRQHLSSLKKLEELHQLGLMCVFFKYYLMGI